MKHSFQTQRLEQHKTKESFSCAKPVWLYLGLVVYLYIQSALPSAAQRMEPAPKDIKDVTVIENLSGQIPLNVAMKDERGNTVTLNQYFKDGKPVIMAFNFFQCPLLCHLILDGIVESMQNMSLEPGRDFELVSVSFDPLDTPTLAQTWKQKYIKQYGKPHTAPGWHFLTGERKNIKQITDAAGYYYQFVEARKEYAHVAAVLVLMPDGKISRYLYGINFDPKTLRLSLVEASEGKIGNTIDRIILTCYYYDHTAGRYAPLAFNIMRIGGGLTILFLGAFLLTLWLREQKRTNTNAEGAQT